MLRYVLAAALSGLAPVISLLMTKPAAAQLPADHFLGGGFYYTRGDVVACASPDAAVALNAPDGGAALGRVNQMRAMMFGRCDDFPDGLPVLVRAVEHGVALVIPNLPHRVVAARFVPSDRVVSDEGKTAQEVVEVGASWVGYDQATGKAGVPQTQHYDRAAALPLQTQAKRTAQPGDTIYATMSVDVLNGDRPIVRGQTNLPDGTELSISIERSNGVPWVSADAEVQKGKFSAGPLDHNGVALGAGTYKMSVIMGAATFQPKAVQEWIGQDGEFLDGPLVTSRYIGRTVVYETPFAVNR